MWFKLVIRFVALLLDRMRPIRGLWRISNGKDESGLFSYSELQGGSLNLCWLRTDCLAQVSKFDYVLTHTRFMGSLKLSSFDGRRVGRYLTSHTMMYTGIVYGLPMDIPVYCITWKTCTMKRWDPARLFDHCHELWPHVGSWRPHVCRVVRLHVCRVVRLLPCKV
jgi:hypothetical protein